MRRPVLPVLVLMVVLAAPFAAAPVSLARFTDSDTAAASLGTGSLAAPTSLAGSGGTTATLTWTPSTSSTATGYRVLRSGTPGSGYGQIGSVTPVTAATATDTPGNGTWYYVLRTYLQSWTSGNSNEASVVVGPTSTGYKGCAIASNAPETTGSGNNDGYEGSPGNACALDGALATDTNSGTRTSTSCTSSRKDRHRFWGYSFGMPASITSVQGITVQLAASIDSTVGTNRICVELSWNGGTGWTTPQAVDLTSTSITSYTLGGATNLWGQPSWTRSQLGTSTFRIRITDVSDDNTRDFRLDYVGAQVSYTP